ncbi:hypothetical protein ACA895_004310 [Vibrio vulnificus]
MENQLTKENAIFVLNTIFAEVYASADMFFEFLKTMKPEEVAENQDVIRIRLSLLLSNAALSCNKFIEFNAKYGQIMHQLVPELNPVRKRLVTEINSRGIPAFRNDLVGHIHSQSLQRPLTILEYQERFDRLTGGLTKLITFLEWLRPIDPEKIDTHYSVCGEIKKLQEALDSLNE